MPLKSFARLMKRGMTAPKSREYWIEGTEELHGQPEQLKRQKTAVDVPLKAENLDREQRIARIKDYAVSLTGCSCRDYMLHNKPCKHMYRLAHELGLFKICDGAASTADWTPKEAVKNHKSKRQASTIAATLPEDHSWLWEDGAVDTKEEKETTIVIDVTAAINEWAERRRDDIEELIRRRSKKR